VGAKVEALEMQKGISQETTTGSDGLYRLSAMLPGVWEITVSAVGFNSSETSDIRADANNAVRVDAKLQVAKANENLTVTIAPPEMQTDRADVHTDISTAELEALPQIGSEGKTFQSLLRLIPGATLPQENNISHVIGQPAVVIQNAVDARAVALRGLTIDVAGHGARRIACR
jgi:hypothetical protein